MAENLAYKPNYGTFWVYNNDSSNLAKYGYLYDWETSKKVCPAGWHLPTLEEWKSLFNYFGGIKSIVFESVKPGGKSGYNSLFGGTRSENGEYTDQGENVYYWSSTEYDTSIAYCFGCEHQNNKAAIGGSYKVCGFSIRCLKDN